MSTEEADISVISPWPGSPFRELLTPSRDVVIVTGAGVSAGCGLPTGADLAVWLRSQRFAEGVDFSDLGALATHPGFVASRISATGSNLRSQMLTAVADFVREKQGQAPPGLSRAMRAIARSPSGLVLTLNYDTLIEEAANLAGRPSRTFGPDDMQQLVSGGIFPMDDELRVVHLHGVSNRPDQLVLDHVSYTDRANSSDVFSLFSAIVGSGKSLCAVGTDYNEDYLATIALRLRPRSARHVVVGEVSVADRLKSGQAYLQPERHGWLVCQFANGDFGVLDSFCERLVGILDAASDEPRLHAASAPVSTSLYAERRLLPVGEEETAASWFEDLSVPQNALLNEHRSVVIGVPGAGKSRLLRELGEGDDRPTVAIRVQDIEDVVGKPARLLRRWLGTADSLGEPAVSAVEIVEGHVRAWIQFDGLDEASLALRTDLARAISAVADAYPQHRFTVSTRPNPAEAEFGSDWRRFELVCDSLWQSRFLEANGVEEGLFWAAMVQGGDALREVLQVAFFLEAAVALWKEGIEVRDARQIALTLLGRALASETQLEPVGESAMQWLRRVALTQQLANAPTVEETQLIALAAAENVGNPKHAADLLARRSLLSVTGTTWTFAHRLFGEALVAEQLLETSPDDWLDCVAPIRDGRSRVVDRWSAPLSMVLAESSQWRSAVARRDEHFAKRATPLTASPWEREAAGLYMWRKAVESDTWIDPMRTRPGLGPTDGEIVAAIIRAEDAPTLDAEVRAGLHSDSRFVRGNAIDVLSAVPIQGIVDMLRTVIRCDDDFVVRRSAASAAGDLNAHELLPFVVERAKNSEDDSESQDMGSVAMHLVADDQKLALALELLAAGNQYVEYYRLPENASRSDQLKWLEAKSGRSGSSLTVGRELERFVRTAATDFEPSMAERIGYLVAVERVRQGEAFELAVTNDDAAKGVIRALDEQQAFVFDSARLLVAIGPEGLRRAGGPRELIEQVRAWSRRSSDSDGSSATAPRPSAGSAEPRTGSKLQQVLALPRDERLTRLVALADLDRADLGELDPGEQRELTGTLDELWGPKDLAEAVRLAGRNAQIQPWATVVLAFGASLRMPLTDPRWAQIATCGFLFAPQIGWLRSSSSSHRRNLALNRTTNARALVHLLRVEEENDYTCVLRAISGWPVTDFDDVDMRTVAELLGRRDDVEGLRGLSGVASPWQRAVDPALAVRGDVPAQRRELSRLTDKIQLGTPGVVDWDSNWLREVEDAGLVPDLERLIRAAGANQRSGDPRGAVLPVISVLGRIGTDGALRVIERMIETRPYPGAQFLVHDLDAMIQQLLETQSQGAARVLAQKRGLPTE